MGIEIKIFLLNNYLKSCLKKIKKAELIALYRIFFSFFTEYLMNLYMLFIAWYALPCT